MPRPAGPTLEPSGDSEAAASVGGTAADAARFAFGRGGLFARGRSRFGRGFRFGFGRSGRFAGRPLLQALEVHLGAVGDAVQLHQQGGAFVAGGDRLAEDDELLVVVREVVPCGFACGDFALRRGERGLQFFAFLAERRHFRRASG